MFCLPQVEEKKTQAKRWGSREVWYPGHQMNAHLQSLRSAKMRMAKFCISKSSCTWVVDILYTAIDNYSVKVAVCGKVVLLFLQSICFKNQYMIFFCLLYTFLSYE
jgi:hypothetical protein